MRLIIKRYLLCPYLPDSLLLNLVLANLLLDLVRHILWSTIAKAATFLPPLVSTPHLMSTVCLVEKQSCYFLSVVLLHEEGAHLLGFSLTAP